MVEGYLRAWHLLCICKEIRFLNKQKKLMKFKIETPWNNRVNEFTINSYGVGDCQFNAIPVNIPPNLIQDCMIELAISEKTGFTWYTAQNEPNIGYKFMNCNNGIGFFYFQNDSLSTTCTATIEITSAGC